MRFRSLQPVELPSAERPTLEQLLTHAKKHGFTHAPRDGHGRRRQFRGYKRLSRDPLVQVAIDYLGQNAYAAFIEGIGYGKFKDKARKDWKEHHAQ